MRYGTGSERVNFKLDPDTKKSFEEVCSGNGSFRQRCADGVRQEGQLGKAHPFEINADPFYSRAISAIWKASCGTSKAERRTSRSMN